MELQERQNGFSAFEMIIDVAKGLPVFFSPRMWERLKGELEHAYGWHITDENNFEKVISYQHRQNTISVTTKPSPHLLKGLLTTGGIAFRIEGQTVFSSGKDFFTHRLADGTKIKRQDNPKAVTDALAPIWVDIIHRGVIALHAIRNEWPQSIERTLQEAIQEIPEPYTKTALVSKQIGMKSLFYILNSFFREPESVYGFDPTPEELKAIGRIKQRMVREYIDAQEPIIKEHIDEFLDIGYESDWDEVLLTNYEVTGAIIYRAPRHETTLEEIETALQRHSVPYEVMIGAADEELIQRMREVHKRTKTMAQFAEDRRRFYEEFPELAEAGGFMKNIVTPALTGAVSGALAGRFSGRNKQQQQPQQPQQQAEEQPAEQPTQQPQQPSQKKGLLNFGKKDKGPDVIGGLASGKTVSQQAANDPTKATQLVQSTLDAIKTLASVQNVQESNAALAWLEYSRLMERKYSADEVIQAAKNFMQMIGEKQANQLSDQELQTLQSLVTAIKDQRVMKTLKKNYGQSQAVQTLEQLDAEVLPTAIQTMSNNVAANANKTIITPESSPSSIHGEIATALQSIDDKQAVKQFLMPIVSKYGQMNDFSKYSWADIAELAKIAQRFGQDIEVDISEIDNAAQTTPTGGTPATAQQLEQQTQTQPQIDTSDFVGKVTQEMMNDPEMIRELLQYAIKKNPANKENLAQKYGIKADTLE